MVDLFENKDFIFIKRADSFSADFEQDLGQRDTCTFAFLPRRESADCGDLVTESGALRSRPAGKHAEETPKCARSADRRVLEAISQMVGRVAPRAPKGSISRKGEPFQSAWRRARSA